MACKAFFRGRIAFTLLSDNIRSFGRKTLYAFGKRKIPSPKNEKRKKYICSNTHSLKQTNLNSSGEPINVSVQSNVKEIYEKILNKSVKLLELCNVYNGVKPFEKGKGRLPQIKKTLKEKPFVFEGEKPNTKWRPLLRGSLFKKYTNLWNNNYWILYGEWLAEPRNPYIFEGDEKIIIIKNGY